MVLTRTASTYDAGVASAMYAEFRRLLIKELEKVDDMFFNVHDSCEEGLDELDDTVLFTVPLLIIVA